MNGTAFSDEGCPELFEYAIDLYQRSPEASCGSRVIRAVGAVCAEADRTRDFAGPLIDVHGHLQLGQSFHDFGVEVGYCPGLQCEFAAPAVADVDDELLRQ